MSVLPVIVRGLSLTVRQTLIRRLSSAHASCSHTFHSSSTAREDDTQASQADAATDSPPEEPEQEAEKKETPEESLPDERDLEHWERAVHLALQDLHRNPTELQQEPTWVENLAGPGQSGWRCLYEDEENATTWWELDLIGGRVPNNELNALLSDDAKYLIFALHEEGKYRVKQIAEFFKIRQQRVMAIVALHKIEAKQVADGYDLDHELHQYVNGGYATKGDGTDGYEGVFACDRIMGVGERHVKVLPRAPHYEVRTGKDGKTYHRNLDELEEKIAKQEDKIMIREFEQALKYNMGETGKTLKRDTGKGRAPKRPKEGFSLVVKPAGSRQPYVAKPDGSKRDLSKDERLLLARQTPWRRRRILS